MLWPCSGMQIKNEDVSNEASPISKVFFNDFWWGSSFCHSSYNISRQSRAWHVMRQKCEAYACVIRGQPLVWPTSNKSYRPITILALRMQFSIGNRILKGAHLFLHMQADTCCPGHTSALKKRPYVMTKTVLPAQLLRYSMKN